MTIRRLAIPILALFLATACGGGGDRQNLTGPSEPSPDPQASSITISPSSATLNALEDTSSFSATVRDQNGTTMSGVSVSWSSANASVATVNGSGDAVAQANGMADIIAQAEGLADSASVTVDQQASEVTVSPGADTLTAGEEVQLSAEANDANGHPIEEASFSWTSSDTTVATVDSSGFVTARASGEVAVTAALDGEEGASDLTVRSKGDGNGDDGPTVAPTVSSISPSPIPEGGTITIAGSDFTTDPDGNTVLIDDVTATVVSASASELEVEVPTYLCQPARDVSVSVETSAGSASSNAPLSPDEAPITLAAGEAGLASNPAGFCFQFEETSSTEQYLIGVQSASRTVGSLTPVQVTSEAADGSGASVLQTQSLSVEPEGRTDSGLEPTIPEWLRDHRRAEIRIRAHERELFRRGVLNPSRLANDKEKLNLSAVVSGVSVGDTVTMRVPDDRFDDLCANYQEVGAVVRAIGDEAILVADTANPSNGFTDSDYQLFSDRIDNDIIATQIEYFGEPSDVDGNGHVVALFSKEVNRTSPGALGFVFAGDFFPRRDCASSDGGEIFYGKVPDPMGEFGDSFATEDARRQAPFVMAHEITHVIQQGRRFVAGAGFMDSWIAEAQATLSEEAVGHNVTGRTPRSNYGFAVAFGADADNIEWYRNAFADVGRYFGFESQTSRIEEAPDACGWWRSDPSPCLSRQLWYGVGWSFLRWISDHLGPSYPGGEAGLHRDIVDTSGDGWSIIESVTGEDFNSLLATWAASLYLDDRVGGVSEAFTIPSWDFFNIYENLAETARLKPFEAGFSDWVAVGDVRASSAGYILLEGTGRPATAVRVTTTSDTQLPSDMQIFVIRVE